MFATLLLEFGIPSVAALALAAGGVSYFYLPIIGKKAAAGCVIVAAASLIYAAGFNERGALDKSAGLAAQIVQMKADVAASKSIVIEANARQAAAEDEASTIQEKVDAYAAALAKRKTPGCSLGADDVSRLRGLAGPRTESKPAAAAR